MDKNEFVKQQAGAFLNYLNKKGSQPFDVWAKSKDFLERDKRAVQELLNDILGELKSMRRHNRNWLNVEDVADYLGLKTNTIYQYINQNRIPFRKVPGSSRLIFSRDEIDSWIETGLSNDQQSEVAKTEASRIWDEL